MFCLIILKLFLTKCKQPLTCKYSTYTFSVMNIALNETYH